MTDNTELQRLVRLRRLVREIATSLKADLDREQAFQMHGSVRECSFEVAQQSPAQRLSRTRH